MAKRGAPGDPGHPGAYVRHHVFPAGMTVTKAAKLLGIGRPALSNFLNGKAALSQEMARRLEHAFGANREELLDLQARYDRRDEAMRTSVVAGRHAPTLVEIKAHRIEKWADTIRAREDLPALLRRLVHHDRRQAHPDRLSRLRERSASRMGWRRRGGWHQRSWIPGGRSGWEFGCNGKPGSKANRDYEKRTNALPPEERRDTTFVFVTPRNWRREGKMGGRESGPGGMDRMCAPTMRATWNSGSNSPRRRKSGSPKGWASPSAAFARPICAGPIGPTFANRLFRLRCSRWWRGLPLI